MLGVIVALNAASGVLGSLAYPHIRRFALNKDVHTYGREAKSHPTFYFTGESDLSGQASSECFSWSQLAQPPSCPTFYLDHRLCLIASINQGDKFDKCCCNATHVIFLVRWSLLQGENVNGNKNGGDSLIAVCVLLSGIVAARFGLWITDLTINQILQERVEEDRRGRQINGLDLFEKQHSVETLQEL